jgi:hypothetical protein
MLFLLLFRFSYTILSHLSTNNIYFNNMELYKLWKLLIFFETSLIMTILVSNKLTAM